MGWPAGVEEQMGLPAAGAPAQGEVRPQETCPPNHSLNLGQVSTMPFSCQGFLVLCCLPPCALLPCNDTLFPWSLCHTPQTQLTAATGGPQPLQLLGPIFMLRPRINPLMGGSGMCGWEWILFCLSSFKAPRAPDRAAAGARTAKDEKGLI